jgi:carboxylesterase type B
MQKNYLIPKSQVEGQEDCLYLNVYTPDVSNMASYWVAMPPQFCTALTHYLLQMRPKVPLEVMVHIHGGGFFSGTGASSFWGPQYLLDKDIVLVSFNYRLGVLG